MTGLIRAVSRDLYNQESEVEIVDKVQAVIEGGQTQEHTTFKVILKDKVTTHDKKVVNKVSQDVKEFIPTFPTSFRISAEQFCNAFPYHLVFDSHLRIKQCGMSIQALFKSSNKDITDRHMEDVFDLIHPNMEMRIINIQMFINAVFMLKVKHEDKSTNKIKKYNGEKQRTMVLKGKAN